MKKRHLLAVLLAVVLLLPSGCGGSNSMGGVTADKNYAAGSAPAAGGAASSPAEAPSLDKELGWGSESEAYAPANGDTDAAQKVVDPAEKIIYSASFTIETLEFDKSVAELERRAAQLGGFVENSTVSGNTWHQSDGTTRVVNRSAYYVLRVPVSRFGEALDMAGELGSIVSSGKNAENVTSRFIDQEARKHSLEVQEERLLELLAKADNVDTLIMLEKRLAEVRYEIEAIERTLRNWQNQVDYSTLTVSLREVERYTPTVPVQRTFPERLGDAFRSGWEGFADGVQDLVLLLVEGLPALLLLAVVVVVVVLLVRRALRKRRGHRQAAHMSPAAGPEKKDE